MRKAWRWKEVVALHGCVVFAGSWLTSSEARQKASTVPRLVWWADYWLGVEPDSRRVLDSGELLRLLLTQYCHTAC